MGDQDFKLIITGDATSAVAATQQAGDGLKKIKIDCSDLGDGSKKLLGISQTTNEELKKTPPEAASKGFKGLSLKGREMREVFAKLNEIIPGLGLAIRGIGETAEAAAAKTAAAEGEVAAANEGLIASAGPLIVVVLALQAAMEAWNAYSEGVKAATEAATEATKKLRDTMHEAFAELDEFNKAMAKASEPSDKYSVSLERQQAVFEAQIKSRRELLKLNEAEEMARAQTPEQKEAIRQRYENAESGLQGQEESGKNNLEQQELEQMKADMATLQEQRDAAEKDKADKAGRGDVDDVDRANKYLGALDEKIEELQRKITNAGEKVGTAQAVQSVYDQSRTVTGAVRNSNYALDAAAHAATVADLSKALEDGVSAQQGIVAAAQSIPASQEAYHAEILRQFLMQRDTNLRLAAQLRQIQFNTK